MLVRIRAQLSQSQIPWASDQKKNKKLVATKQQTYASISSTEVMKLVDLTNLVV